MADKFRVGQRVRIVGTFINISKFLRLIKIVLAVLATLLIVFINLVKSIGFNPSSKTSESISEYENDLWSEIWKWALK